MMFLLCIFFFSWETTYKCSYRRYYGPCHPSLLFP